MNIVFDNIIFYLQNSGGGTIYWLEIIKRALSDDSFKSLFSEPKAKLTNRFRSSLFIQPALQEKLPLFFLRVLNFSIPIKGQFLFHSSYYRIATAKQAINIVTIHDFTSEFYFKGLRKFIHQRRKRKAIIHSKGIICISNNTKRDLLKLYPFIDENKIRVIYNGVSNNFYNIEKSKFNVPEDYADLLKSKYILYVGHRTSYKNFFVAVETLTLLSDDFKLLIVGEKLSNEELKAIDKCIKNRYYCLSGIDNETLNVFYNYAFCLIYPSSYEGFGIPLIEAMKAGCPVVTTNKSSIPEVAGDAAIMVDEIKAENFKSAILKLRDTNLRDNLVNKGKKQASNFSWDKCYNEVKEFYFEIYNQNK